MNTRTLIAGGIVLSLALIYFFVIRGSGGSSLSVGADAFAILQPDAVGTISIQSVQKGKESTRLVLEREGESWKLNDSLYALAPKVGRLLTALQQQRVRQPISKAGQKRIKELMELRRLEITIDDTAGK